MFMEIGAFLDEGLAEGIEDNMKPVSKAMDNLGALTSKSFESDLAFNATGSLGKLNTSLNSGMTSQNAQDLAGTGIEQTVNIYSPTAMNPSEIARENKKALQRLALAF